MFRDHGHAILNEQLKQFKTKAEDAEVALIENAETTQLLVETVEIAETEAALLWQKAEQTETQLNEMMRQNENAQREKRELQYQLMQAEEYARQLGESDANLGRGTGLHGFRRGSTPPQARAQPFLSLTHASHQLPTPIESGWRTLI